MENNNNGFNKIVFKKIEKFMPGLHLSSLSVDFSIDAEIKNLSIKNFQYIFVPRNEN